MEAQGASGGSTTAFESLAEALKEQAPDVVLVPAALKAVLGAVDKAKYEKDGSFEGFMKSRIGGAVVMQYNDDKPDFYPIPPDVFANKYGAVPMSDVATKNAKLFKELNGNEDVASVIANDPLTVAVRSCSRSINAYCALGRQKSPAALDDVTRALNVPSTVRIGKTNDHFAPFGARARRL